MTTPGKAFYERQLALIGAKDCDAIATQQYTPDAQLISFDFVVSGTDALRSHFEGYLDKLGYIKVLSTDKYRETEDTVFLEATVDTAIAKVRVYDAFLLKGGKAWRHFTGILSMEPKG